MDLVVVGPSATVRSSMQIAFEQLADESLTRSVPGISRSVSLLKGSEKFGADRFETMKWVGCSTDWPC